MKDRPLKSEESLQLQKRRKSLLNAMGKALHARDRNKYVSTRTNIEKVQQQSAAGGSTQGSKLSSIKTR